MGLKLSGEEILRALSTANEAAKRETPSPAEAAAAEAWAARIASLQQEDSPKTYLAVLGVLLTARSLHGPDQLDVRHIQAGTSPKGYAAASIGGKLAAFAKEQRIDLRATSSQPMNNQPFTFKDRITDDMGAQAKHSAAWHNFLGIVNEVNAMSPAEASAVLGLLFRMARKIDQASGIRVHIARPGKATLDKVASAVAQFVAERSDNGKVGQSFVAAVLDLIYGPDNVVLGDTQDPDATTPGDVQVRDAQGVWLWAEAKQKVILTGDVTGFLRKVHDAGGERVAYFALTNSNYSGHIQPAGIEREAERLGIGIRLLDSPEATLDWLLPLAPGSYAAVAANLLDRMHQRMAESRCPSATTALFESLATRFGEIAD